MSKSKNYKQRISVDLVETLGKGGVKGWEDVCPFGEMSTAMFSGQALQGLYRKD